MPRRGRRRYAAELVAREEAALGLVKEMLGYEGREAGREAAVAEQRLAAARLEAAEVDGDLARAQAEGPASHRKRDYIDKVPLAPPLRRNCQLQPAEACGCGMFAGARLYTSGNTCTCVCITL